MLDTIDAGEKPRLSRVHNSLTLDGLSAPVHPKRKKTITALTGRKAVGNDLNVRAVRKADFCVVAGRKTGVCGPSA